MSIDGMRTDSPPRTLFEKIWDNHVVHEESGRQTLLYIDLQLVHEVTSPQAFEGLRLAGRKVRRPELTVATPDHNVPTTDRGLPIADPKIDQLRATATRPPARTSSRSCKSSPSSNMSRLSRE